MVNAYHGDVSRGTSTSSVLRLNGKQRLRRLVAVRELGPGPDLLESSPTAQQEHLLPLALGFPSTMERAV